MHWGAVNRTAHCKHSEYCESHESPGETFFLLHGIASLCCSFLEGVHRKSRRKSLVINPRQAFLSTNIPPFRFRSGTVPNALPLSSTVATTRRAVRRSAHFRVSALRASATAEDSVAALLRTYAFAGETGWGPKLKSSKSGVETPKKNLK